MRKLNTLCGVLSTYCIVNPNLPWNRIGLRLRNWGWNWRGNLEQRGRSCYQGTWFESWRNISWIHSMQFLVSDFGQIKQSIDRT